MKKALLFLLVFVVLFTPVISRANNALKKLGRGAANIVTCPMEIPYRIGEANKENGPVAAFTWGILNGIWQTCLRAATGVYEVVTFPIPLPKNYKPVKDDPEFFLEEGLF